MTELLIGVLLMQLVQLVIAGVIVFFSVRIACNYLARRVGEEIRNVMFGPKELDVRYASSLPPVGEL